MDQKVQYHYTLFILDLCFHIFYGITGFDLTNSNTRYMKLNPYMNANVRNNTWTKYATLNTSKVMVFPVKVLTKICIVQKQAWERK
jgi:hypothetical protein